jgi:hypothetical protein
MLLDPIFDAKLFDYYPIAYCSEDVRIKFLNVLRAAFNLIVLTLPLS